MNLFDNKIYIIDVKANGLKIHLKIGDSIQCFRRRPQRVRLCTLHCNRRNPQMVYISNLSWSYGEVTIVVAATFEQKESWRHTCCDTQSRFLWSHGRHVWSLVREARSSEVFFLLGFPWVIGIVKRPFHFFFQVVLVFWLICSRLRPTLFFRCISPPWKFALLDRKF